MHFIYPEFLFALFALAIPIIVHLFNFRRFKKIYFTNVRFLREIKQDTQSKSKLKHLLILFSRILAVIFLVLAFAQPYLPAAHQHVGSGNERVSVYIDNSFSMDALGKNGSLLETARKKAGEIAAAYKPSDQFQLLTADFEGRHQRLVSRDEFVSLLDEVKSGPASRSLSEIVGRQEEALSVTGEKSRNTAYVISDFQKSVSDFTAVKSDSSLKIFFVPVESFKQNDLSIDTCFLSKPFVQLNVPSELHVKIRNTGTIDAENVPIKLIINNVQKAVGSINVVAGTVGDALLSFTLSQPGWQESKLSITDYPITFDDDFYFSFNLRENISILSINGLHAGNSISAVFGNDPYFKLKNNPAGQIDYSSFSTQQLIVLNELDNISSGLTQELKKYISLGGSLFIIPSDNIDFPSYQSLAESLSIQSYNQKIENSDKVSRIESKHALFSDVFEKGKTLPENVDFPVVSSYYSFSTVTGKNSQSVMTLQSGQPFLISSVSGKGSVYALCSSLNIASGNFARHALFVPIMLRAALKNSSEITAPLIIGRSHDFTITDSVVSVDNVFHLVNHAYNFDVIPESRIIADNSTLSIHNQVTKAGNYEVMSGAKQIGLISFNFDRKESDLSVYSSDEIIEQTSKLSSLNSEVINPEGKDLSHTIYQINEGKRYWKYCILAALLFLALEIILIRFYKPIPKPV